MIRCGRLAVEGEEEEVIAISSRISKPRQKVGKLSNNPYSSRGLDEFSRLTDELSAKREFYASKTGTPLESVRFVRSSRGWKLAVFKNGGHGGPDRVLILPPIRTKEHKESQNRTDGNRGDGNDIGKGEINGSAEKDDSVSVNILPWWSGYLKIVVFGVLSVSVIMARKSALRAAAMAGVIVVGFLQMRLQGFVTLISIFSKPLLYCKGGKSYAKGIVQASPENEVVAEFGFQGDSLFSLTAPTSPTVFSKDSRSQEPNTQLENEKTFNEKKKLERIVSMDGRAAKKPIRVQEADIFLKRRKASSDTINTTAIASVMIIALFFLVFYGKLTAVCLTSVWWYVLPMFRTKVANTPHNGKVNMDLQSSDYMKKIYH